MDSLKPEQSTSKNTISSIIITADNIGINNNLPDSWQENFFKIDNAVLLYTRSSHLCKPISWEDNKSQNTLRMFWF